MLQPDLSNLELLIKLPPNEVNSAIVALTLSLNHVSVMQSISSICIYSSTGVLSDDMMDGHLVFTSVCSLHFILM